MCHTGACPMMGSVSERKAWEQSREEGGCAVHAGTERMQCSLSSAATNLLYKRAQRAEMVMFSLDTSWNICNVPADVKC